MILLHDLCGAIPEFRPKVIQLAGLPSHTTAVAEFPVLDPATIEIPDYHELAWLVCEQWIYVVEYHNIQIEKQYVALDGHLGCEHPQFAPP
jgi:hypothetical protein